MVEKMNYPSDVIQSLSTRKGVVGKIDPTHRWLDNSFFPPLSVVLRFLVIRDTYNPLKSLKCRRIRRNTCRSKDWQTPSKAISFFFLL